MKNNLKNNEKRGRYIVKVISGGQNGVDLAALRTAKNVGIQTGGTIPKGFKTIDGNKPEYKALYGLCESKSVNYPSRTRANVKDSDGTLRICYDLNSRGEKCTKNFIDKLKKPYFDIDLNSLDNLNLIDKIFKWIIKNKIKILNIAGNTKTRFPDIEDKTEEILNKLFQLFV
jgi:hypothetical protein